jgi:hypothetical protein
MNLQQTSLLAYQNVKDLSQKRMAVYRVIQSLGTACNQEIAEALHWPINCVTGRTRELVKAGLVDILRKDIYAPTGKKVIFWKVL